MSFFYLTPIEGHMPLSTLRECVIKRAEHLRRVLNGHQFIYSEHLIEDSPLDNTGHFMLKLSAVLSQNDALINLYKLGEEKYFKYRIGKAPVGMVRVLCKKVMRDLSRMRGDFNSTHLSALRAVCRKLQLRDIAEHVCTTDHPYDCQLHRVDVHFSLCLPLVGRRLVEIENGVARVHCGRWKDFLVALFHTHLSFNLRGKNACAYENDARIMSIVDELVQFCTDESRDSVALARGSIDDESRFFPLCMKNLHVSLRENHRLSHAERFHYTLFLKDVGVSIDDAISFWKDEYSREASGSVCLHTWQENEKKYVYGTRHAYGLEGARKTYSTPSCFKIQCNSTAKEGGCPFKDFDNSRFIRLIEPSILNNTDAMRDIYTQKENGCCRDACNSYMRALAKSNYATKYSKTKPTEISSMVTQSPATVYKQMKKTMALNDK